MPFPKETNETLEPLGERGYNEMPLILDFTECEKKFNIDKLQLNERIVLINKIHIYSKMKWHDVFRSPYKGLGFEHIRIKLLNKKAPSCIPSDLEKILVLRLQNNKTIIGYQNEDRFMVVWIDRQRKVYNH